MPCWAKYSATRSATLLLLSAGAFPVAAWAQEVPQDKPTPDGVSFDLEIRERTEIVDRVALAIEDDRGVSTSYGRLLAGVSAKSGPLSAYMQLGTHLRVGGRGSAPPVARDPFDVQQVYVDVALGEPDRGLRVRAGRSEMAFELVASRDAPNVRRSWDGGRVTGSLGGWTLDAFAARVVEPRIGVLDDTSRSGDRLRGLHLTGARGKVGPIGLSAFLYDVDQRTFSLLAGTAPARTTTIGGVADWKLADLDWSLGGARQTGRFAGRSIDAFYVEAEVGRRWGGSGAPRLALRGSAFSGGPPGADRVRTFNPLFPNFAYSTEAALQSPSNLVKVALLADVRPRPKLLLEYRGEALWRYSAADAYYVPTGFTPILPRPGSSRWVGVQQQIRATWNFDPNLTLVGAIVRFDAGDALRREGRGSETFALTQITYRWNSVPGDGGRP